MNDYGGFNFLNLDYLFYQFYRFAKWFYITISNILSGGKNGGTGDSGTATSTVSDASSNVTTSAQTFSQWLTHTLSDLITFLKVFIPYIILLLVTLILYAWISSWRHHQKTHEDGHKFVIPEKPKAKNPKWEQVQQYIASDKESDWRLAVMEADTILDDLTQSLNLPGADLGERLKAASKDKFLTLDNAWEAHKVRNQIAHEGSNFQFNLRDARQTILLYESVFREFSFI